MYQTSILLIATLTWVVVGVVGGDDHSTKMSSLSKKEIIKEKKIQEIQVCYGSYLFMRVQSRQWEIPRRVWFVPRYIRREVEIYPHNTSPGCVYELGSLVIEFVTEEHVGEYKILKQEWGPTTASTFLRLIVTECTDTRKVNYGDKVDIKMTVEPTLLMFYPANKQNFYPTNDTSKGIEIWNLESFNKPSKGEVPCTRKDYECDWFVKAENYGIKYMDPLTTRRGEIWYVGKLRATQKDQGMYVARRENGRLIHKFQIFVKVKTQSQKVKDSQDVKITFGHFARNYDLNFRPKDQPLFGPSITELVKNGTLSSNRVANVMPDEVTLKDVQYYDSGTYQAFDLEGNLFLTLELTVLLTSVTKVTKPVLWWIVKHVLPAIAIASLLCCLRKMCCACNAKSSGYAEAPPASNQIEEEMMQHPPPNIIIEPPASLTSDDSCPPSYPSYPSYPSQHIQHPAIRMDLDDEGPSCTMPSAPTFELGDFLNNQSPLSSGAPTCDVYTSDKINFL